ncbi:alpha-ketoglutarate-dependent dioxygenase alkB homolog 7, mitochondrial isoform X3 [Rhodnius prolixus]|uniref:alpha-ketoglutarate-dependent dioxygenase alkB homolog 7, mitochondrial isoform X3 n=1 Tax=Rhodnius prolixus TaxID=13249 RepID=UPI003D188958
MPEEWQEHHKEAIHGFREFESEKWSERNCAIFEKVRKCAFIDDSDYMSAVHVLDLAENGYIKPHVDSVRFCGRTIAGLSLLTDSIMRLISEKDQMSVDILVSRRSLYIMRDFVRYNFTHEILPNEISVFKGKKITKGRRISLICRSNPKEVPEAT